MAEEASTLARRRVALNARRVRERLGMTQETAAERIDCSVQALRRVEGAAAVVTVDFLARIAAAYRVDVVELFVAAGPWKAPKAGRPRLDIVSGRHDRRGKRGRTA